MSHEKQFFTLPLFLGMKWLLAKIMLSQINIYEVISNKPVNFFVHSYAKISST